MRLDCKPVRLSTGSMKDPVLLDHECELIAILDGATLAEAEHIVKCVNNHEPLQDLLRSTLAMLGDLKAGYPWRELHIDLETISDKARRLGVEVEPKT